MIQDPVILPKEIFALDRDTSWILGQPCFAVADIAMILRWNGREVARRAEAEQAAALHFLLTCWHRFGANAWREEGERLLNEIRRRHRREHDMAEGGL
jgi:hypothetical protein